MSSPFLPLLGSLNPSTLLRHRNLLLACHLTNLREAIATSHPIHLTVFCWNVNQLLPQTVDFSSVLDPTTDILVVNLQETIALTSLKSSKDKIEDWAAVLTTSLNMLDTSKSFKCIHKTALLGLTTLLIVKESLEDQIHDVQSDSIGLGYLRWGNKGCIGLTFKLGGLDVGQELSLDTLEYPHVARLKRLPSVQVQVFNAHLVHGEGAAVVSQRYDSLAKIGNKLKVVDPSVGLTNTTLFKNTNGVPDERERHCEEDLNVHLKLSVAEKEKLGNGLATLTDPALTQVHDPRTCVIVSGDTNYRLNCGWDNQIGASFDRKDVDALVAAGNYSDIILRDQLTMERFKNNVFIGFTEAEIQFPPTFKVSGVSKSSAGCIPRYDPKRLPAYTDRILFVPRDHMHLTNYTSAPLCGSDHLPVLASFDVAADMIDSTILHRYKEEFNLKWDRIINSIQLIDVDPNVKIISKVGQIDSPADNFLFIQHLSLLNLNLTFDIMNGESALVCVTLHNNVQETLLFEFKDEDSSRWFNSNKSLIDFTPLETDNIKYPDVDYVLNGVVSNELCAITPNSDVLVTVQLKPNGPGVVNKTFKLAIPSLLEIPSAHKYVAVTLNVKDIFLPSLAEFEERQFENVCSAFDILLGNTHSKGLMDRVNDVSSPSDFTMAEWDLVRTLTLWTFEGHQVALELLRVLYVWLKCHNADLNAKIDERSKTIYNYVVKLIMWLKLDHNSGYTHFGWLFQDPQELLEVLEREDYKFDLN